MDKQRMTKFNVLAVILIIIFGASLTPITFQNDTFYTIKIGEHIMQNGIDMQDPFSWHENLPYTYPHWLYDVITYLVYSVGGYLGVYILTIIFACILGIVMYFLNVKLVKNQVTSFIITIASMYFLRDYITARAQLVTFIMFLLTIYCIENFLETKKKRYAIGLFIIPTIIANIHLAVWPFFFILFLPYIGEYFVATLSRSYIAIKKLKLKKLKSKQSETEEEKLKIEKIENDILQLEERKEKIKENAYKMQIEKNDNVKWLIIIMLACVLTGLLTPLNGTPYTYLYDTLRGNTTQFINEHLPLTLIENAEFLGIILVFLIILIFTDTKIRLRDLFMVGGLLFLSFKTRRQISMFILICSLILNRLTVSLFKKYDEKGLEAINKGITTLVGRLITCVIVLVFSSMMFAPKRYNTFIDTSSYPVEATEYIKENLDIDNIKLYNEYNYGSYLLLNDIPVFIDSRCDLYTKEYNKQKDIFSDFINTNNIGVYYEEKMEEYGITHVILYKNSKLNMFISRDENYKQLYEDDHFCIYERLSV